MKPSSPRSSYVPTAALLCPVIIANPACQQNIKLDPEPDPRIRVQGTVHIPEGVTFPRDAKLKIIINWYDTPVAEHVIDAPNNWPATFSIPIAWPTGKGEPTYSVEVYARAELAGRDALISETKAYRYPGETNFTLLLHPAIE